MKKAFVVLAVIFLINLPGVYYGWYDEFWWFDTALHFFGGFFVAMLMAAYLKDHLLPQEKIKNALIIAGATVFIGVIWEFAEYIGNQTLIDLIYERFEIRTYFMGDLNDTISDLLTDVIGATTFISLGSSLKSKIKS